MLDTLDMDEQVQIKICGLTQESDVALALSLGADYCGFITYSGSPRGVSLDRAAELASVVPASRRVLVDVEPSPDFLKEALQAGFENFQIHTKVADASDMLKELSAIVGKNRLWVAPRLKPDEKFPEGIFEISRTILMDTYSKDQIGGTGQTGDWEGFQSLQRAYPTVRFILAGGLNPENAAEAVRESGATHIDVNSGVEAAPGVKDADKLRALFNRFRNRS